MLLCVVSLCAKKESNPKIFRPPPGAGVGPGSESGGVGGFWWDGRVSSPVHCHFYMNKMPLMDNKCRKIKSAEILKVY